MTVSGVPATSLWPSGNRNRRGIRGGLSQKDRRQKGSQKDRRQKGSHKASCQGPAQKGKSPAAPAKAPAD